MPHQISKERNMINLNKKDSLADAVESVLQQEALKGNQHKIDKNHNNKIDGEDFKILRGEKKAVKKEEVEQIDELSKSTLGSYAKKASYDATIKRTIASDFEHLSDKARKPSSKAASKELANKYKAKSWQRKKGVGKAVDRLTKEEVMPKTLKQFKEGWDDMLKAVKERNKPQPNGGSGVKQGSRYGGSKQKDEPEKDTDEKK